MSEPYLGEIQIFGFNFPPHDWALCAGEVIAVSQNPALFSLIGTLYGGDGRSNFQLPDLMGRMPVHPGNYPYTSQLGQALGEESITLDINSMPIHTHQLNATSDPGDWIKPAAGGILAKSMEESYIAPDNRLTAMAADSVSDNGATQPHNNMQPYLALNFCIALKGVYPTRD